MSSENVIPATFTFSTRAIAALEVYRADVDATEQDKYLCAGVGWGYGTLKDGHRYEQVSVGACTQSYLPQVKDLIRKVSGVDVF